MEITRSEQIQPTRLNFSEEMDGKREERKICGRFKRWEAER